MRCAELVQYLDSYRDQELSPELAHEIKLHLDSCPACQEVWQTLQEEVQLFSTLPKDSKAIPEPMRNDLSRRLRRGIYIGLIRLSVIILPLIFVLYGISGFRWEPALPISRWFWLIGMGLLFVALLPLCYQWFRDAKKIVWLDRMMKEK